MAPRFLRGMCGGVEHALALCCGCEFGGGGFACRAVGLVWEGSVGEFRWERCFGIVGDQRSVGVVCGGALEGCVEDGDDVVDAAHAAAVTEFLGRGEAPWDFPGVWISLLFGSFGRVSMGLP